MSIVDTALAAGVERLLREVAADIVMPRFRQLADHEIIEKQPGDLVTVADRLAEERLTEGLSALLPEARVVGEEAVAADASLLDGLGSGLAWIVDPIDGTHNYAEGKTPFAIMVGLIRDGQTIGGWILDAASGRLCHAVLGGGAFIDGARIAAQPSGASPLVAALATQYLPPEVRDDLRARTPGRVNEVAVPRCAGEQYPRVILGENDAALFWRAWPWDHAPGALILTEAGGRIAHFDGSPYQPAERKLGLLAAATPELWDRVRAILFD